MIRFSPVAFALAFSVTYAAVFWFNLPMFTYYPEAGIFQWGRAGVPNAGPGMAWYGLMADAAVVALVAALIVPNRILDKALTNYLWVIPAAAMLTCVYLLRNLFLS